MLSQALSNLARLLVLAAAAVASTTAAAAASLCTASEQAVWSCSAGKKRFAVCASGDLSGSTGYMQYRVMKGAILEFVYPSSQKHPKGLFTLEVLPRGASLGFRNGEYTYVIYEPLIGPATIDVSKSEGAVTTITCSSATDGLTLTPTQELLSRVGIYKELSSQ